MDPGRVKEIAASGGREAHKCGVAHQFTHEEAKVAGVKGGMAHHARRGKVPRAQQTDS